MSFLKKLTAAAIRTAVILPATIVADVVTLGGTINDHNGRCEPYSKCVLKDIKEDLGDAMKELEA